MENLRINTNHKNFYFRAIAVVFITCLLIGLFSLSTYISNNQSVKISCEKAKDLCRIEESRLFFGKKVQEFPLSSIIGDAYRNTVGCHYGSCTYNIRIPCKIENQYKNIQIYTYTYRGDLLQWIVNRFNELKNNEKFLKNDKINGFSIDTGDLPKKIGILQIIPFILLIASVVLIFTIPIEVDLIFDDKSMNIIYTYLFRKSVKKVDYSNIKEFSYFNKMNITYTLTYLTRNWGLQEAVTDFTNKKECLEVLNKINNFLENKKDGI